MVPEGWTEVQLDALASVERGRFSVRPRNDPRFYGGDCPFVQTGDITRSRIYLRDFTQTLNENGVAVSKIFPKGSILMTIAANIGEVALTRIPVACPDSVVGIVPNPQTTDPVWLVHRLELEKKSLDRNAPKLAQKNINLEVLRPLRIVTPPLAEQKKIAEILSVWDQAIETTENLLANAETQKRSLMQKLLTSKRRPGNHQWRWRVLRLDQLAEINPGRMTTIPSTVTFIPMEGVSEDGRIIGATARSAETIANGFTAFQEGDVLVAKITPCFENGKGCHATSLENGIGFGSTEFHVVRARNPGDQRLLYHITNSRDFRGRGRVNMTGSAGQKRVPADFVRSYSLRLPADPEARAEIARVLDVAELGADRLRGVRSQLEREKRSLMQQLLTGKKRVKV